MSIVYCRCMIDTDGGRSDEVDRICEMEGPDQMKRGRATSLCSRRLGLLVRCQWRSWMAG